MDQAEKTPLPTRLLHNGETVDHVDASATSDATLGGERSLRRLGKFELLERVGAGGFGEVWKARDTELDRLVAIKLLHAGRIADPADRERFFREARAAAQLRHPCIAAVYEVAELENTPAIVSAFIEGATLRDLKRIRALSFREAAVVMAHVAEALEYAHSMKLVHRDVKPANVMIEFGPGRDAHSPLDLSGASHASSASAPHSATSIANSSSTTHSGPRALLLDFGLALRDEIESTLTADGQIIGTPAYMSPEQAAGEGHHVDRRTDVYSLGAVLYELLTGELPFSGSRVALINQVLHDEPRPPRDINPRIPRDLETICLKAMAKSRNNRYPTARALGEDLDRWLAGIPILARHVGPLERTWRWCRRHRALAAMLALTAIVLIAGTAISTTMAVIASKRADKIAEINKDLARANQEKTLAATQAQEQARIAEEQSQLAYKTLESVIFDIQTKLVAVPAAQQVRGNLLKTALTGLEQLSAKLRADKRVDRSTAVATLNLAEVFRQVSNAAGAKTRQSANELYDRAVATFEVLHQAAPDDRVAQNDLAEACLLFAINLSRTDDLGANVTTQMVEAQKDRPLLIRCGQLGRRAIELRRKLLESSPNDRSAKYEVARALTEWAYQEVRSGNAEASRDALLEAHSLLKALLADDPDEVSYRFLFGRAASRLGDYYYDMVQGAHEQAAPYYEESLAVLTALAAERPQDYDAQMEFANTWSRMGDLFAARKEYERALTAFWKELEVTQALEKLAPNNLQTMADSSISYDHVSRELIRLERYQEAIPVLVRVLEIRAGLMTADPENRRHHAQVLRPTKRLAIAYEKLGRIKDAKETYESGLLVLKAFRTRTGDHSLDDHITTMETELKKLPAATQED
jgi:serine/threonine protein kinase/tetratricopeptide (TPR) repeat protein